MYNLKRSKNNSKTGLKSIISNHTMCNLVYKTGFPLTVTASTQNSYSYCWRANSIYDPDVQNIGKNKSVEGYTQLSGMFNYYQVYWCTCKVTATNLYSQPMRVVLGTDNTSSNYGVTELASDIGSRSGAKVRVLAPSGSEGCSVTTYYTVNPRYVWGVSKALYGQDEFASVFGASPTKNCYFWTTIGQYDDNAPSSNAVVTFTVEFVYHTRLYDIIEDVDTQS